MRGRKPVPTVLKLLRNNPGKRRLNAEEPEPSQLNVACPPELVDPVAQAEWVRGIVPVIERGHITADDRVLAIAHCEAWATRRSQLAEAAKHPHVVAVGPGKYPQPNPAQVMANKTLLILLKIDAELGLTPTSRSRIHVPSSPHVSAVERFRREKHG